MESVNTLEAVVQKQVADYHGPALKATTYYFEDVVERVYAVVIIPEFDPKRRWKSNVVVLARIVDDFVVIDEDTTDRPLWEELVRAGVPRAQIICAYLGETLPEKVSSAE